MSEIILKANINECKVENWQSNTGEVNARVMNVEMSEDLSNCDNQFVTFELADGTKYESKVTDGKANIPEFYKSQFIKIGLYAENTDGEKRYSSKPANVYVNAGSYPDGSSEPPKPTPGDYAELLEQLADLEKGTIKVFTEKVDIWKLDTGVYYLNGGFSFSETIFIESGKHILITYKPSPSIEAVRYIHFCNSTNSQNWLPIECGYTNGTTLERYDILDTSRIAERIAGGFYGSQIPTSQMVIDYVKEQLGVIDNGYY